MHGVCFALDRDASFAGECSLRAPGRSCEGAADREEIQCGFARPHLFREAALERGLGPGDQAWVVFDGCFTGRSGQTRASRCEIVPSSKDGDGEEEAEIGQDDLGVYGPAFAGDQVERRHDRGFAPGAREGLCCFSNGGGGQLEGRRRSWATWLGTCPDPADQQPR